MVDHAPLEYTTPGDYCFRALIYYRRGCYIHRRVRYVLKKKQIILVE